jgi:Protein of unknown function (DUF1640)
MIPLDRYEVEKLTASQRLDLNLEKGRMRDELQVGNAGGPTGATLAKSASERIKVVCAFICCCAHPVCPVSPQQALRDKSNELEIKIDKEINALKAAVELTKNETIK